MTTEIVLQNDTPLASSSALQEAFALLAYGLTAGSQRQYRHTFESWQTWCAAHNVAPYDLSARHVIRFLDATNLARQTKMARLAHLRRLAQTDPEPRVRHTVAALLK